MERERLRRVKLRVKTPVKTFTVDVTYLAQNWGAPFIVVFIALLVGAAVYLALGNELVANKLAEYAYHSLVVGVLLQLTCFLLAECRQRKEGSS